MQTNNRIRVLYLLAVIGVAAVTLLVFYKIAYGWTPENNPLAGPVIETVPPHAVGISEIAWAGTRASSSDEWFELSNTQGFVTITLDGWYIELGMDDHTTRTISLPRFSIGINGFGLCERTDDNATSVAADCIYAGSLPNSGVQTMTLYSEVDDIHHQLVFPQADWGSYGGSIVRASMSWVQYPVDGWVTSGVGTATDAQGYFIFGSPGEINPIPVYDCTPAVPLVDLDWKVQIQYAQSGDPFMVFILDFVMTDGTEATSEITWEPEPAAEGMWWTTVVATESTMTPACIDVVETVTDFTENRFNEIPQHGLDYMPKRLVDTVDFLVDFQRSNMFQVSLPVVSNQ